MQNLMRTLLGRPYNPADSRQQLLPDEGSIRTTAVGEPPAGVGAHGSKR